MTIARWTPPVAPTRQEQFLLKRLDRVRKLLGFLRLHRHELFDDPFQEELAAMYRTTGAGKAARPPAMMAMATLVQGYLGMSDAEMIELTVVDLRVQMVLGCLGAEPPLLARRVAGIPRATDRGRPGSSRAGTHGRFGEGDQGLRSAQAAEKPARRDRFESSGGCGTRRRHVQLAGPCGAQCGELCRRPARVDPDQVCRQAGMPLLVESSIKRALDIDWNDAAAKREAIKTFARQLDSLQAWIERQLPDALAQPPLKEHVATLVQIRTQDLEPDPQGRGSRMRDGVAPNRRVSIADKAMRHGRKSKSQRINGFKRHIAADVDRGLILACAITPANRPEGDAIPSLTIDMTHQGLDVDDLLIDRGYINSALVDDVLGRRGTIVCKPWTARNGGLFPKSAFTINIRNRTIECPDGQRQGFSFGTVVEFDPDRCDRCAQRPQCTTAARGHGRSVTIAENEPLQQRLRKQIQTSTGRAALRERTIIEHKLAHISQRQGNNAR